MKSKLHSLKQHQANQNLTPLQERLTYVIRKGGVPYLIQQTGLSESMLYQYANKKAFPTLPKLALIAQECGVSLTWLFGGEHSDALPLPQQDTPLRLTVVDDVMSPTIPAQVDIEYRPIKPQQKKKRLLDGIYILTNQQGLMVRRVQWLEAEQVYRVFGDNPNYLPQQLEEIAPVGTVTAIIQPI